VGWRNEHARTRADLQVLVRSGGAGLKFRMTNPPEPGPIGPTTPCVGRPPRDPLPADGGILYGGRKATRQRDDRVKPIMQNLLSISMSVSQSIRNFDCGDKHP